MTGSDLAPLARTLGVAETSLRLADHRGASCTGHLEIEGRACFVKSAPENASGPLNAEAAGLEHLRATGILTVPATIGLDDAGGRTWLVLEWLDLQPLTGASARQLGEQLAAHHRAATADRHGLDHDNWIGATPQVNTPIADWTEFLFEHRIGAMLDRLAAAGVDLGGDVKAALREAWTKAFADYRPVPSLLHGDLWSGNAGQRPDGTPVVFDPAVHYGDRECDLAMAALFGGFGQDFFDAYDGTWPLEPGWERRREVYQLYHVLNHGLLFGGGYVAVARRRIGQLLHGAA